MCGCAELLKKLYFFPFKNKSRRAFSPPPSPAVSHNKDLPSAQANKEKIRLLTEEM